MNIVDDLMEAAKGGGSTCKVCAFLDTLEGDDGTRTDILIRAKANGRNTISADRVSSVLKAHGASVGSTTVSRHRSNCPPRGADTQA